MQITHYFKFMSNLNILHITDLHLDDPASQNENLRTGYYIDYINKLFNTIEIDVTKIDYIVCTGDIVNRGKVVNFDHADKIFKYIRERSKVNKDYSFFTIGNHDLTLDASGKGDGSRFQKFVEDNTDKPTIKDELYSLKIDNSKKVCFCLFDSIFNEEKIVTTIPGSQGILPSQLSANTLDTLVNSIDAAVPKDYLLFIASHFPMAISTQNEMQIEEPGWTEKHLWKSGNAIAKRLVDRRLKSKTFFLFGDGHLPDFWAANPDIQFFMTGMFGGDYVNTTTKTTAGDIEPYNKTNQARLFTFYNNNTESHITTYNYKPIGFKQSTQTGKWEAVPMKLRVLKNDFVAEEKKTNPQKEEPSEESSRFEKKSTTQIELIAPHLQLEILSEVTNRGLYKVARTSSSKNESSLGWLPINQLFLKSELLIRCVDRAITWSSEKAKKQPDYETYLIVGVGCWGSIIGSQISARVGVRNVCISGNLTGMNKSNYESVETTYDYLTSFPTIQNIIIVTDVISTGNTLLKIKKGIESKCGFKQSWIAISIIADKRQKRTAAIDEYNFLGSFCVDLPIPIVNNELLPDESIFPIEFDYR